MKSILSVVVGGVVTILIAAGTIYCAYLIFFSKTGLGSIGGWFGVAFGISLLYCRLYDIFRKK